MCHSAERNGEEPRGKERRGYHEAEISPVPDGARRRAEAPGRKLRAHRKYRSSGPFQEREITSPPRTSLGGVARRESQHPDQQPPWRGAPPWRQDRTKAVQKIEGHTPETPERRRRRSDRGAARCQEKKRQNQKGEVKVARWTALPVRGSLGTLGIEKPLPKSGVSIWQSVESSVTPRGLGNPWGIEKDTLGERERDKVERRCGEFITSDSERWVRYRLHELRGHQLRCHCPPRAKENTFAQLTSKLLITYPSIRALCHRSLGFRFGCASLQRATCAHVKKIQEVLKEVTSRCAQASLPAPFDAFRSRRSPCEKQRRNSPRCHREECRN